MLDVRPRGGDVDDHLLPRRTRSGSSAGGSGRPPPRRRSARRSARCASRRAMRASGVPFGASIGATSTRAACRRAPGRRPASPCAVKRLEAAGEQAGTPASSARATGQIRRGRACGAQATTFTILCGTTMTFFGRLPSSARCTASSARTAASISAIFGVPRHGHVGPLLAVDLHRQSDGVLDQQLRLERRPGLGRPPGCRGRARPSTPRRGAASSGGTAAPGSRPPRAPPRRNPASAAGLSLMRARRAHWRTRRCARRRR